MRIVVWRELNALPIPHSITEWSRIGVRKEVNWLNWRVHRWFCKLEGKTEGERGKWCNQSFVEKEREGKLVKCNKLSITEATGKGGTNWVPGGWVWGVIDECFLILQSTLQEIAYHHFPSCWLEDTQSSMLLWNAVCVMKKTVNDPLSLSKLVLCAQQYVVVWWIEMCAYHGDIVPNVDEFQNGALVLWIQAQYSQPTLDPSHSQVTACSLCKAILGRI